MSTGRRHHAHPPSGRYPRTLRVNEVLREVLAEELERLADADERLRLVTITGVEVAADLKTAMVYFSTLSEDAAAVLEERRSQLQHTVSRQVRMKRTPRLRFSADPAITAGLRVDELLRRVQQARQGQTHPADSADEGG